MSQLQMFAIETNGEFDRELPEGAKIYTVVEHKACPYLCAEVSPTAPKRVRRFFVCPMGTEKADKKLPPSSWPRPQPKELPDVEMTFIGHVQHGELELFVFELPPPDLASAGGRDQKEPLADALPDG